MRGKPKRTRPTVNVASAVDSARRHRENLALYAALHRRNTPPAEELGAAAAKVLELVERDGLAEIGVGSQLHAQISDALARAPKAKKRKTK